MCEGNLPVNCAGRAWRGCVMRKAVVLVSLAGMLVGGCSGRRGLGVGVIVIEPTGVSVKGWLDNKSSVNLAVGWPKDATHIHADYAFHNFSAVRVDEGDLALYMGVGGRLKMWDDTARDDQLAVRVPLGIDYIFEGGRLDLFLEVVPALVVAPDSDFEVDGALGVRFFFK